MAGTQEQLDALEAAINEGARQVSYDGKTITYRSLTEMEGIRRRLRRDLGLDAAGPVRKHVAHGKGLGGTSVTSSRTWDGGLQ